MQQEYGLEASYLVGTMIELPAPPCAPARSPESAEFFSLAPMISQTTLGISRDDGARFIGEYTAKGGFFEIRSLRFH